MVVAAEMKFSEYVDLLLAALYRLEQEQGGGGEYFDLNQISLLFTKKVPRPWVFDAAKVLEARCLARCVFTFGAIYAQLTGEGRIYVEEEKGTGIVKQFHFAPGDFLDLSAESKQLVVASPHAGGANADQIEKERRPVFELLDKIEELLRQEKTLDQHEREDLLEDTQMIRRQLRKREPNRTALAALLEPLSRVASITGLVANLIQMINS